MSNTLTLTPSLSLFNPPDIMYFHFLRSVSNSSGPSLSLFKQAHIVTFTFYFL